MVVAPEGQEEARHAARPESGFLLEAHSPTRTKHTDSYTILKRNMYSLTDGLQSLHDRKESNSCVSLTYD